jgi:hypothetical protein
MLRGIVAALLVCVPAGAGATTYAKIISIAGCPLVAGPPTYPESAFIDSIKDAVAASWTTDAGPASVLYCDAQLPGEATAFDDAELEYDWYPYQYDPGPAIAAYLDGRTNWPDGGWYSVTEEIGECQATVPTTTVPTSQVSLFTPLCPTTGSASLVASGGQVAYPLSVHVLVFLPVQANDYSQVDVYRLIIHYEAP